MEKPKSNSQAWAALAIVILLWATQDKKVSEAHFNSRDEYYCSVINSIGQRAREAENKADSLASKVRDLENDVDRLKRTLR
jgi:uncharacterized protein Yka (UPF0111/DUF47 family)